MLAAAVSAIAGVALYLPHLRAGFASEDFLILGYLTGKGLLATLRDELVSPWLGLAPVGFWRPVSTFLLAVELRLFGLAPARFHAAHLLLHAFDAWLVALLVRRVGWRRRWREDGATASAAWSRGPAAAAWMPVAAAALFAVHPFHPSAVLFTGAFATLFGAVFSLLSMLCFLEAREVEASDVEGKQDAAVPDRSRRPLDLAALLLFVLALGCYEASAALPAVLLLTLALLPPSSRVEPTRVAKIVAAVRATAPFFVVLVGYLAVRMAVLGGGLGGYAALRERFLSSPLARARDLVAVVGTIAHPHFGGAATGPWVWGLGVAAAMTVLALARSTVSARRARKLSNDSERADGSAAAAYGDPVSPWRPAVAGLAWMTLFLAPFAFVGLTPANGRYAYLAIAGVVLVLCALATPIAARWPRAGALVVAVALGAVAADWLAPLRSTLVGYDRASALVAAVRADLLGVAAEHADEDVVLLVESPPDFIKGGAGEPIVKVLQYGLAQSVRPPFGPLHRSPIPLPAVLGRDAAAALGALPGTVRYRWDVHAERLMAVAAAAPPPATLDFGSLDVDRQLLSTPCRSCESTRLVLLTAALPLVLAPDQLDARAARFQVPRDLLSSLARLGPGPAFAWIEEHAEPGAAATASSPIARFELGADALGSLADAAAKIRRAR